MVRGLCEAGPRAGGGRDTSGLLQGKPAFHLSLFPADACFIALSLPQPFFLLDKYGHYQIAGRFLSRTALWCCVIVDQTTATTCVFCKVTPVQKTLLHPAAGWWKIHPHVRPFSFFSKRMSYETLNHNVVFCWK